MQRRPRWFLMCGYAASGKSTVARTLGADGAVVLNRDDLMIRVAGIEYDSADYAARLPSVTDFLWGIAAQISATGTDVVLDWNHWSRQRRAESAERARAAGAEPVVVWVQTPVETAVARAAQRGSEKGSLVHSLTAEAVRHSAEIFEPPRPDEGVEIRVIDPADPSH